MLDATPENIARMRTEAGLTQAQAAELVHLGAAKRWSEYERGVAPIDAARWELFLIKAGKHPHYRPVKGARGSSAAPALTFSHDLTTSITNPPRE